MGRMRLYADDATRQRASRARRAQQRAASLHRLIYDKAVRNDPAQREPMIAELDRLDRLSRRRLERENPHVIQHARGSPEAQRAALRVIRTIAARDNLPEIEALAWKLLEPLWGKRLSKKKRPGYDGHERSPP